MYKLLGEKWIPVDIDRKRTKKRAWKSGLFYRNSI